MLIFLVFYGVFFVLFVFVLCLVYPMLQLSLNYIFLRRVWRYQRGNQNTYIEEEQTTQWPKEKVQKDKQRSTKHTYKTKDRVTRTPRKTGRDELRLSGRVGSSCSTSDTRRVNLVVNSVISREWGKDREVLTTSEAYPWSFVTQIFHSGQPSHGGDRKIFEAMTSTLPKGTLGSVASLLAATLYQGISDRNHKFWNTVSSERYILHMLLECCYI
jgi:hypothetical protein